MGNPVFHSQNSVARHGGSIQDYLPIHSLIDSSQAAMGDTRHRALTHNSWFITTILPQIFGDSITNSDGTEISVTEIGQQHVLEDYGGLFIPTVQDWLANIAFADWMDNAKGQAVPSSRRRIAEQVAAVVAEAQETSDETGNSDLEAEVEKALSEMKPPPDLPRLLPPVFTGGLDTGIIN